MGRFIERYHELRDALANIREKEAHVGLAWLLLGARLLGWPMVALHALSGDGVAYSAIGLALLVPASVFPLRGLLRALRSSRLPAPAILWTAALLDVLWVFFGYVASGLTAAYYPFALALLLMFNGVLVGGAAILLLAGLAILLLIGAALMGGLASTLRVGYTGQAGILAGAGLAAALAGNRLRAAGRTVERLASALAASRTDHDQFVDALPIGVAEVTPDGRVALNETARDMLHLSRRPSFPLDTVRRRVPEAADAAETLLGEAATSASLSGEDVVESREGERTLAWRVTSSARPAPRGLNWSALAAPPAYGAVRSDAPQTHPRRLRAVMVLTDVTAQRDAVEAQVRADRLTAVAELSAGLAHEVRNPIAALCSAAEQLEESPALRGDDRMLAQLALRESDRINKLVSEFFDFARGKGGAAAHHDLRPLIHHARTVAQHAVSGVGIEFDVDIPDVAVWVDAELFHRVLSNILLNAAQASPDHATVHVVARVGRDGALDIRVRDYGKGVHPDDRDRIFEPFVTRRPGGTGLGLAIAQRSAHLMGGAISVESPQEGSGALFCVDIPGKKQPSGSSTTA